MEGDITREKNLLKRDEQKVKEVQADVEGLRKRGKGTSALSRALISLFHFICIFFFFFFFTLFSWNWVGIVIPVSLLGTQTAEIDALLKAIWELAEQKDVLDVNFKYPSPDSEEAKLVKAIDNLKDQIESERKVFFDLSSCLFFLLSFFIFIFYFLFIYLFYFIILFLFLFIIFIYFFIYFFYLVFCLFYNVIIIIFSV
jgi:hypothetical protein